MGGMQIALGTQPGLDLFESTVFLLISPAPLDGQRLVVMIGTTLARIVPQSLGIFAYPRRGAAFMRRWSWRRRTHRVSKPPAARADASFRFAANLREHEIEASVSSRSRLRQGKAADDLPPAIRQIETRPP